MIDLGANEKDIVEGIEDAVQEGFPEYLDILFPLVPDVNNMINRFGGSIDLLSLHRRKSRKYMESYLIAHGVRPKNETDETK